MGERVVGRGTIGGLVDPFVEGDDESRRVAHEKRLRALAADFAFTGFACAMTPNLQRAVTPRQADRQGSVSLRSFASG